MTFREFGVILENTLAKIMTIWFWHIKQHVIAKWPQHEEKSQVNVWPQHEEKSQVNTGPSWELNPRQ